MSQLLDILSYFHYLSCFPYTLHTVQFQFIRHSLDLLDNVLYDWLLAFYKCSVIFGCLNATLIGSYQLNRKLVSNSCLVWFIPLMIITCLVILFWEYLISLVSNRLNVCVWQIRRLIFKTSVHKHQIPAGCNYLSK